jgi:hypothetical protein
VCNVNDATEIEIHTAEPLVPGPSPLEGEIAIAKQKHNKSPRKFPAELIQAGSETLMSAIHELINSILNKEELPYQWTEFIILPCKI